MAEQSSSSNESVLDEVEEFLRAMHTEKIKSKRKPETDPKMAASTVRIPALTNIEGDEEEEEVTLEEILQILPEAESTQQPTQETELPPPQQTVETGAAPEAAAAAIQLPDALIRALITFTTAEKPSRLFFAHHSFVWQEFYAARGGANGEQFGDLTPQQLCAAFCAQVLPRIYASGIKLSTHEQRCLELLALHPEYERNAEGWRRVKREERVASEHEAKARQDIRLVRNVDEVDESESCAETDSGAAAACAEFQLDSEQPQPRPPNTLVGAETYRPRYGGYNFQFTKENAALLSAALSTDYELSECTLFEPEELHRRLREAKRNFEKNGEMPPNCGNAVQLCKKLRELTEMREAIWKLLRKKFA